MFIDSDQKRFGAYVAQTIFHHSQAFQTEKKKKLCLAFFISQKKPKVFKKNENFKSWLQKRIGNPGLKHNQYTTDHTVNIIVFAE